MSCILQLEKLEYQSVQMQVCAVQSALQHSHIVRRLGKPPLSLCASEFPRTCVTVAMHTQATHHDQGL